MYIFIYGKDNFRSQKFLSDNIDRFIKERDPQKLNTVILDCLNNNRVDFMGQILAQPFLAEKRMIVLKNLLISKNEELQMEIVKRLKENNLPENNIIIFWESIDTVKTKLGKELLDILKKGKFSSKFDELKGVDLASWIREEIKNRGGSVDNTAVEYLVKESKGDIWHLNSLINQLVSYCNDREINVSDVEIFLEERFDDNIFNLVDAIVGKREKEVYKMIQEQYRIGEDVQFMFAMILRQFRIIIELRDLFERQSKMNSDEIAKKLKLHPFVVKKTLPLTRHYNMEKLKCIYDDLLELDIQIKTSKGNNEMLLDLFVARVCV
ncbi:MAG: DNA polymerase III subunit delta [Candidatus Magasanikbacteria bacterium RIFCSPHIGHO2_01_FULL_33_34]|uniref:DNA polymerase III subunit delta n=1 Tax=Candidatus Magasanikbacteria bacterium RIFCSPHIGHO2_01_FULL_33_34 TaxID=1798671 RepID=A0A1F6LKH3_9BACT|nr:MAG: DNA polymerase III subunit delta [Candidatus Magasanikbacteria bacterium RIFCSPHIGHO2_01_FULL_33_34]OGH65604.1 MAG: DNA polymerase III subunit delta [Candidatus Magasanikbacteria bacterium RIFCSPHIGHO2_02_FULL_33_17]OGH75813.1 MAG: DNA polymerase III subunit delta [Candidatus Magasanikbacteria bacterium RIFCSPLOWO2_01_FULL_33_34]